MGLPDPGRLKMPGLERWRVVADVLERRDAQDAQWGEQNPPDGTGGDAMLLGRSMPWIAGMLKRACQAAHERGEDTWALIALEEVFEAMAETDPAKIRHEVIDAAAVFMAWAEAIDRREARTRLISAELGAGAHHGSTPRCADGCGYPVAVAGQVCGECADAEDCAP